MPEKPLKTDTQSAIDRLQQKKLEQDTSWTSRFLALLWPIAATLITAALGYSSYRVQKNQEIADLKDKHRDLVHQALANATDDTGAGERKIAGIWELLQVWQERDSDDESVIANTLASQLSLTDNKDELSRCAAVDVIAQLNTKEDIDSSDPNSRARVQRTVRLLFGDKSGWVGSVTRLNILFKSKQPEAWARECNSSTDVSALDATKEAIRYNWKYLRNANFRGVDLAGARLYEGDLSSALLLEANLTNTTFFCANLRDADLRGDNLDAKNLRYVNISDYTKLPDDIALKKDETFRLSDSEWLQWRNHNFNLKNGHPVIKGDFTSDDLCETLNEKSIKQNQALRGW